MTITVIMKYKILSSLALVTLGIAAIAPMASAGIAKDAYNGKVYSTGYAPREDVYVFYVDLPLIKKVTANECGFVSYTLPPVLSSLAPSFDGGTAVSLTSIPLITDKALVPKCANGVASNIPPSGVTRVQTDPSANVKVVWTGNTAFNQYDIAFPMPKERKLKSNACGVVTISPSTAYPSTGNFRIGVTPFNFDTLATVNAGPGCKNNTLLIPAGFPN